MTQEVLPAAQRVRNILLDSLFNDDEMQGDAVPEGAVLSDGILNPFAFHPKRLESHREEIKQLISELVTDSFLKGKGGGTSFLNLCVDRNENQWAEHKTMDEFVVLAQALGLAGYNFKRELWHALPGQVPYIWFEG